MSYQEVIVVQKVFQMFSGSEKINLCGMPYYTDLIRPTLQKQAPQKLETKTTIIFPILIRLFISNSPVLITLNGADCQKE